MAKIISVCSLKGGVGKTSCTVNLAYYLAVKKRKKVLVLDMDCQGGATHSLSSRIDNFSPNIYDLLEGRSSLENCAKHYRKNLHIVSASDFTWKIFDDGMNEKLPKILEDAKENYDYIFIDLAPATFKNSNVPLHHSDYCIIPVDCNSTLAVLGAEKMGSMIHNIMHNENPDLQLLGILPNMEAKTKISKQAKEYLGNYGDDLLPYVRRNIDISNANAMGKSIFEHRSKSNGAIDFEKLGKEITRRLKK